MTREPRITRRALLKLGLAAGLTSGLSVGLASGSAASAQAADRAASSVRWGMAINMRALRDPNILPRMIQACHAAHNVPDIPPPSSFNKPDHRVPWIQPEVFPRLFLEHDARYLPDYLRDLRIPALCNHCDNPPCVRVCPTGATFQEKDGRVGMDQHRCIGCRYCMAACPYGARSFNFLDPRPFIADPVPSYPTRVRGVVEKCTFCSERLPLSLAPWCVEAAQGALVFGNLNDPNSDVRRLLNEYPALQRKAELGTGPAVYYVL